MGEVDHAHDAEDQRQPARHQEQQQPVLDAVQYLDEKKDEAVGHRQSAISPNGKKQSAEAARPPHAMLQPVAGSARSLTATRTNRFCSPCALRAFTSPVTAVRPEISSVPVS